MGNKRLVINMVASVVSFLTSSCISFFLTPYVVSQIGSAAFGFVGLGANFISYMSLVSIALNSMSGRFISIEIHRNKAEASNSYFNSLLVANIIMVSVLALPSVLIVLYVNRLLNVPAYLLSDVRVLFALLFICFLVNVLVSAFSVATFVRNRLDLSAIYSIVVNIINAILLVSLFHLLKPKIIYYGIAGLVTTILNLFTNLYLTKQLLPEIVINRKYFDYSKVKELLSAGVWNTIIRLSQLLLDGLDLLIANLLIGAVAMGSLAIAKTVPMLITAIMGVLLGVFGPQFTIQFAQDDQDGLLRSIKSSMKTVGTLIGILIAMFIAFGDIFFSLWVPTQNAKELYILSIITVGCLIVSASINPIYVIFSVTNKLKANAMVMIISGIVSTLTVLALLKTTSLGLYAIAGVSTVIGLIRNLTFTPIYGARCLNQKWNVFYPPMFSTVMTTLVVTLEAYFIRQIWGVHTWAQLIACACVAGILGIAIFMFMNFNKAERNKIIGSIAKHVKTR